MEDKPYKLKSILLGISIAIIFVFFVVYGIKAFYKEPKFENFCKPGTSIDYAYQDGNSPYYPYAYPERVKGVPEDTCSSFYVEYDKMRKSCAEQKLDMIYEVNDKGCQVAKECTSCNQDYRNALNIYNRNVFIVSGIVGIIVIIIGALLNLPSVSVGLFGGGVLTIIYGTMNYWSELADWARFIILGIALVVLIYLGYRKFKK